MKLNYNLQGAERKALVAAISDIIGEDAKYIGGRSAVYQIGEYTVDKNGELEGPDNISLEAWLREKGFEAEGREANEPETEAETDEPVTEAEADEPETEAEAQPEAPEAQQEAEAQREAPAFEDLNMTEREEFGLGQERRDPIGENGMQASDCPEPESRTYQAELSDPECPDRMEIFGAEDDVDAIRQAKEYATGEVVLLELNELDDDYNIIRSVNIPPTLTIEVPLSGFTPEKLENLKAMIAAKAPLLKAALGTDEVPVIKTDETLRFPWFNQIDAEHTEVYATLIAQMCEAAKTKVRVTAKERNFTNLKYAMRCWLLSLGFIGNGFKTARKILLEKLEGNGSWLNGKPVEAEEIAADE